MFIHLCAEFSIQGPVTEPARIQGNKKMFIKSMKLNQLRQFIFK